MGDLLSYGSTAIPAGTTLSFSVRHGNTASPDGTWSAFQPVTNGGQVTGSSRYVQYQVVMTTSSADATPVVDDVAIGYGDVVPDTDPPGITSRTPASGATNVALGTNVTVTFDEAMNPSSISSATVRLRAQGRGRRMFLRL